MKQISRQNAIEQGLTTYFTGAPCLRGHIANRKVASRTCTACDNQKGKLFRDANPDLIRARKKIDAIKNAKRIKLYALQYAKDNSKTLSDYRKNRYENKREEILAKQRVYASANRDKILLRSLDWQKENPIKVHARNARRRARKSSAVPGWFSEFDNFVWVEAADLVRRRSVETGIEWHADHMIPLACRRVCGLHVAANCQVIPKALNLRKSNSMRLSDPMEWLRHI